MDWFTSTNELHERIYAPYGLKLQCPVGAMSVVVREVHLEGPLQVPAAHDQ
jgi:hypothetical protein